MAVVIEFERPAVISEDTTNSLDEYRGFRHVVRNVYSFSLSAIRIEPLVKKLPDLFNTIKNELKDFLSELSMGIIVPCNL